MDIPVHRCLYARMTKQLLQHFWLHPCFDCASRVCMTQCMHTKATDPCFVTELVKVGIIRTVFHRRSGSEVDENEVSHDKC